MNLLKNIKTDIKTILSRVDLNIGSIDAATVAKLATEAYLKGLHRAGLVGETDIKITTFFPPAEIDIIIQYDDYTYTSHATLLDTGPRITEFTK